MVWSKIITIIINGSGMVMLQRALQMEGQCKRIAIMA